MSLDILLMTPPPVDFSQGLRWVGSLEVCDGCGEEYPMCWIELTDGRLLCAACLAEMEYPVDNSVCGV